MIRQEYLASRQQRMSQRSLSQSVTKVLSPSDNMRFNYKIMAKLIGTSLPEGA
jgi:hypothetical protein